MNIRGKTTELYFDNQKKISTRELISVLQRQQKLNLPVYISSDEEGNTISTILDIQLYKDGILMFPNETFEKICHWKLYDGEV
jgi:hypothetical protein